MPHKHNKHEAVSNVSPDLIWEVVRKQNAFLVQRNTGGGSRFSRDPFNLTNTHSRKHAGFLNEKAISIAPGEKGGITLKTKKAHEKSHHKPSEHHNETGFGSQKSGRKTYTSIANQTAKNGYRSDLRQSAVARASAIRKSQRPVKPSPERKLRGNKAKAAAEDA